MTTPAQRSRANAPALRRFLAGILFCFALFFTVVARAQYSQDDPLVARSVSGQFIVTATAQFSWLLLRPEFADNTNFVRLEPALLAVAAERFKQLLWQRLGLKPASPWRGQIHLALRPAHSPDDDVTITSSFSLRSWHYEVNLPDLLTRNRYARALSAVLLLEIANRENTAVGGSAEIPPWLVDGLAQQVFNEDAARLILSLPNRSVNGLPLSSMDRKQQGLDSLSPARLILQDSTPLTFNQLSWPTDEQLNGDDGGVYLASVQLFVHELLGLPNGQKRLRNLLARLPGCENWQTAFFDVYQADFPRPIEAEKWWSLRLVNFMAYDANSRLTAADSSERLDELLRVQVEIRYSSNSLPAHAEISLQTAIRDLVPPQRDDVLQGTLRNLELAQYRFAQPFAGLANGYCSTLMDFLGEGSLPPGQTMNNRAASGQKHATLKDTISRLDELDLNRRQWIARLNFDFVPRHLHGPSPLGANLGQLDSR